MRCLDEAAAAALGGEFEQLAPAGWTCCYMIYACERVRDYDRAAQWCGEVEEFSRRMHIRFVNGTCRAHYAGVLVWAGDWDNAERVLVDALEDLTATRPFWRSEAVVRLAVLRRRQGRPSEARELFAQAEHHALADLGVGELRLEAGDAAGAREDMERVLRQLPAENMTTRAAPLELLVRALAALGESESAAAHVEELESIAAAVPTLPMRASASFAAGVVAAAAGDGETARRHLQDAIELFAKGGAPFETAHARLELADVLVAMGHEDEAAHEAAAALERCDELGAAAQGARARALLGPSAPHRGPAQRRTPLTPASSRSCVSSPTGSATGRSRTASASASTPSTAICRTPTAGSAVARELRRSRRRTGSSCSSAARRGPPGHATARTRLARSGEDGARPRADTRR